MFESTVYKISRVVVPFFMRHTFLKKVYGLGNLPKGPFIIACNHASHLDPIVLYAIMEMKLKRRVCFLAKKELFETHVLGFLLRSYAIIPIDRQAGGKEGLRYGLERLKQGEIIGIFPEGTRTKDGSLGDPKTGVARLALWAGVPIVPCVIDNSFSIFRKGWIVPRPRRTNVYFGKPIEVSSYDTDSTEDWRLLSARVMEEIRRLLEKSEYYCMY